jgi:hypothetical protein
MCRYLYRRDAVAVKCRYLYRRDAVAVKCRYLYRRDAVPVKCRYLYRRDAVAVMCRYLYRRDAVAVMCRYLYRREPTARLLKEIAALMACGRKQETNPVLWSARTSATAVLDEANIFLSQKQTYRSFLRQSILTKPPLK